MKKKIFAGVALFVLMCALSSCREKIPVSIPDVPENKGDANVFYLENGLYDIGEYKSDEKYEYFTGEPVYEFVPRDDYGLLVPFSGKEKLFKVEYRDENDVGFDVAESKYGLCTTDGKVVVEPVYSYVNSFTSPDGFTYYTLSYYMNKVGVVHTTSCQLLIPADGSWSAQMDDYGYVVSADEGIITMFQSYLETGKTSYRFYDYEGNLLFETDEYNGVNGFSGGYTIARGFYPEDDQSGSYDYSLDGFCVYLDKNGNVAFDGFADGTSFNKSGVASVRLSGEKKYALMNTNGEFLTESIYDSLYSTGIDGYFQGFVEKENQRHVFNSEGELIHTIEAGTNYVSIETLPDGQMMYSYYDAKQNREMLYRLSDNTPIVCNENGMMADYYYGNGYFVYKEAEGSEKYGVEAKAFVFDINGETVATIDRFRYASWMDNEAKLIGYSRSAFDGETEFVIYDLERAEEVAVFPNCYYAGLIGKNKNIVAAGIEKRDEDNIYTKYSFYDIAAKSYISGFENFNSYKTAEVGGKCYFSIVKPDGVILYDEDFNIILRKHFDTNV